MNSKRWRLPLHCPDFRPRLWPGCCANCPSRADHGRTGRSACRQYGRSTRRWNDGAAAAPAPARTGRKRAGCIERAAENPYVSATSSPSVIRCHHHPVISA